MKLKLSKYIDKIGIEFEGFYSPDFLSALSDIESGSLIRDVHNDGSLSSDDSIPENYRSKEAITRPLLSLELDTILNIFDKEFKDKNYLINDSTGLHYHISLKDNAFAHLCKPTFYDQYIKMFAATSQRIFKERKNNSYALTNIDDHYDGEIEKHFRYQSDHRYCFINYSYMEHGTVEFRGYGSRYATIKGLRRMIQDTSDLITEFVDADNEKIKETLKEEEKKNEVINIHLSNKEEFAINNNTYPPEWNFSDDININFDASDMDLFGDECKKGYRPEICLVYDVRLHKYLGKKPIDLEFCHTLSTDPEEKRYIVKLYKALEKSDQKIVTADLIINIKN